jgi:hypothetical protein
MQRTHSASAAETRRLQRLVTSNAVSASIADVNQLGIRILGLKGIPVKKGARLEALLDCASELKRMPQRCVPLLVGELVDACATLPSRQEILALGAVFEFQKPPAWSVLQAHPCKTI